MICLDKNLSKFLEYWQDKFYYGYIRDFTLCKYDSAYFIENYCTINGVRIKLNSFQKELCKKLDERINSIEQLIEITDDMQQFIEECLKPIYQFQWLKEIPIDPVLFNNMVFWVAYNDKRLMI